MSTRHSFLAAVLIGVLSTAVAGWSQAAPAAEVPAVPLTGGVNSEDRMLTPPPVSGADYPVVFTSEEHSNFLRGGITFDFAHSDNVLGAGVTPVSDNSYSIWPTLALDETTGRTKLEFSYAPGFTFYQQTTGRDETDQNLAVDYEYRLSPHVTMRLRDTFQKSSDAFNSPGEGLFNGVSGSLGATSNLVIAPIADRLSNTGNAGMSYQFSANAMVGFNATFGNLHYPDPGQVQGELFDSSSQVVSAFHALRIARRHYLGVAYQYQRLLAYPGAGTTETQTNAGILFYTWLPTSRVSVSAFAGPQFAATTQPALPESHLLAPDAGGSLSWQTERTALAASYIHSIIGGGGLIGASRAGAATAWARQRVAKGWTAEINGAYVNNDVIVVAGLPDTSGHSIAASAALTREFNPRFRVQGGYTRLHQIYANISEISQYPDTNREWVTVSYQFTKALGR